MSFIKKYWIAVISIIIVIGVLYYFGKKTVYYFNYQEYLKTEVEELKRKNNSLDSLYKATVIQKDKIRIIKDKIDISEDLNQLESLLQEYKLLKEKESSQPIQETPEELLKYFQKEFQ